MSTPVNGHESQFLLQQYLRAAEAALRAGHGPRALDIAEDAVRHGLEHPNLLVLAGQRRMQLGEFDSALPLLTRARELAPHNADVLNTLAGCLMQTGRARDSLALFDAAIRQAPGQAMLRFNKALALEKLGEPDKTRRELERALELEPRDPKVLGWLALLASQRDDMAAARDYARRALAIDPQLSIAHLSLASAETAARNYPAARSHLAAVLNDRMATPVNRAIAQSQMGDVLDGEGNETEAFAAWRAAKTALKHHYAPAYAQPGMETARTMLARLARYFSTVSPAQWRANTSAPKPERSHVFLIGFPRSGTTLLETVLASHPDIETMSERDCLSDAVNAFLTADEGLDRLAQLTADALEPYRAAYWRAAEAAGQPLSRPVFVDKMPLTTSLLPLVAKLFPHAKILFALRDPRDVVLSCFRRRFGMTGQMYELLTLEGAAGYYDAVMRLGQTYRTLLGLAFCDTRHETLIADFEAETRRICEFLGVTWTADLAQFAERARTTNIDTPSSAQVARGLSREGAGQWHRYARELEPVLPKLAPWVARFGYGEN